MNWGLLFTFLIGLFFILGLLVFHISKDKKKMTIFASSCAFVVVLGLIIFDLLPEVIETSNWWSIIFILLGLFLLKIIDIFVPHHHHHHKDIHDNVKEHDEHLNHIGIITVIALIFHNFIEGIGLYSVTLTDVKSGLLLGLGIGLHNLPLGIQIGSLEQDKKNNWLIGVLVLSSFIGGLVALSFGNIPEIVNNLILSLTLGMILHILIFELLGELINNAKKKEATYGIIIGIVVLIIINIL